MKGRAAQATPLTKAPKVIRRRQWFGFNSSRRRRFIAVPTAKRQTTVANAAMHQTTARVVMPRLIALIRSAETDTSAFTVSVVGRRSSVAAACACLTASSSRGAFI
ncbi:hypothetical protein D3C87_1842250 [compost metagenome]